MALKDNPHLQPYVLTDVTPTGKELGTGSYGTVVEVSYRQVVCAGKRLHETLVDTGNEGASRIVQKYLKECQLMSSLRHPNITQFLGLCFLPGTRLPLIVMERLETNLDDLLENMPNLPLSLKRSVLEDAASGLLYLHKMEPPIIHRDLTSKNVLLTSSLMAKITDLGNSRIVDLRPGQMATRLTEFPGTLVYMPPEALDDRHQYGPSLDVFSFGHLSLYTLTQVFPGDLLPSTYYPNNSQVIHARTELERREAYIEQLKTFCGTTITLVELVKQCLQNIPEQRPSTEELLTTLQGLRAEVEGDYGGPIKLDLVRVKLIKEIKEKDKRLREQQELHEMELQAIRINLEEIKQHITELSAQTQQKQNELVLKDTQFQQLQDEVAAERHEVQQVLAAKNEIIQQLQGLRDEARTLKEENNLSKQEGKAPIQIAWRRGPDMPFEMSGFIQSVVHESKKVFVGGGASPQGENIVMEYDVESNKWNTLPPYKAIWFAMVIVRNQLLLVGGKNYSSSGHSNELGVWSTDSQEWTHPYPGMPTARCRCSAVSYNQWLIVAGGWAQNCEISCVEVLNTDDKQWHIGCSTPRTWCNMKTASAGHVAYFGGAGTNVYSLSLPDLIADLHSVHSTKVSERQDKIWKELPREPVRDSTPLSFRGLLFLVGGVEHSYKMATTAIHYFNPLSREWVKVGDWPSARSKCACVMIEDKELFVAGGWEIKIRSRRMDSAHLEVNTCVF